VKFWAIMALGLTAVSLACGGGGSHKSSMLPIAASSSNVQPIVVNSGPAGNYANGLFTSVTLCVPATSNCQTIDGILVDTGSFGLRILSSAGGGALNLSLPHYGPPALRHAGAAHLLACGLSRKEIGDHLGHADYEPATRIYAQVDRAGLRQVAEFDLGGLP